MYGKGAGSQLPVFNVKSTEMFYSDAYAIQKFTGQHVTVISKFGFKLSNLYFDAN